jgi:hypothetical protein
MNKLVKKEVKWPFRDLKNYKQMHEKTARDKGVLEAFCAAKTLTQARRVLFGKGGVR